ncbi:MULTISPECIES: DUF1572 family protein [Sphingobacterium]|jgi:Protein of unknown function (DUF1572)|uniref:DUF1572 domain-containing protein n=1 Tax=Sphingobacterium multivorum TaxID=28454 RepID=A0A654DQF7_SPHMU|nr:MULTISPECIES: DUF1572 family protein [Sphingobacterium]QQT60760.1 DUF1572 family protein [Sphingobacterium multivorum]VXD08174.1 conserved hypothetical protein [Sphingobacterium multivorum]HAL53226.1 hypothetical protein [Sphingobacterium sp.]
MDNFLATCIKQFQYYKSLGDKTLAQLSTEQLFWQPNDSSNSIALIVKHLGGNMLSRWTDFLTTDGEKQNRNRDQEFENSWVDRDELITYWNAGWSCLFQAIESLEEEDLAKIIYIRNQGHTVMEAILRQLAHYPYHIGQMLYIGKICLDDKWTSLSIPKGSSASYNREKFSHEKQQQHFTSEFIKGNQDNLS